MSPDESLLPYRGFLRRSAPGAGSDRPKPRRRWAKERLFRPPDFPCFPAAGDRSSAPPH